MGLLARLRSGEVLVGDGAMGTMLMARGLAAGQCPEALNLGKPEVLAEVARLYIEAGADLVETNTFGGNPIKLALYGLDSKTEEINRKAVEAARSACKAMEASRSAGKALVLGSVGPTGKLLKPFGDAEPAALFEAFLRQAKALIEAGADAVCVETMTDLEEASLAVRAAKTVRPAIPVIATMTFDKGPKGFFTMMGVGLKKAVEGLKAAGADVVGSNCGNGAENMVAIAREMRGLTDLPLLIQPNAGLPRLAEGKTVYPESPDFMAEKARELAAAGVAVVGGCCGTAPDHIRAIRRALKPQL
ncbi:MAG: homocysteine S-methyltransferase family protein [Elusimicrobia bacterium]|nr:homocysteine S-methyltransferase family protein [Elusimicrobiota bacterium]